MLNSGGKGPPSELMCFEELHRFSASPLKSLFETNRNSKKEFQKN
jgi:hypothetical protein